MAMFDKGKVSSPSDEEIRTKVKRTRRSEHHLYYYNIVSSVAINMMLWKIRNTQTDNDKTIFMFPKAIFAAAQRSHILLMIQLVNI